MHKMNFYFVKYFSVSFVEEVLFWLGEVLLDSEMQCCIADLNVHLLGDTAASLPISGLLFPPLI